ncbi:MAG: MBL fold metallo-hydrolase [Myxococcales bacterium]|nr:MBL fold metallo-hydrolase [Myxococcales bacterium]MCB9750596.1 MBL fold metallo-hydrolase [Myxococcales bacterium]
METRAFFDDDTYTLTYVVFDPTSRDAVVIDPVMDLNTLTWRTSTRSADEVARFVAERSLKVRWVLDTHAHADHLSGMELLKQKFGAPTAIGARITQVQDLFRGLYNMPELPADGSQWDELLADGQQLDAGSLKVEAIATPGHTPACLTYKIGDALFTGDALFMPDYGTGRCDFPAGSAEALYRSVHDRLYALPDATRVYVGHDYQPNGRPLAFETTIGESKRDNVQLRAETTLEDFVDFRTRRDATLKPPRLILPSLQVNIAAGRLPTPEGNGKRYLKLPLNHLGRDE